MTNTIIESICTTLYQEYGYKNYIENVKQGFDVPCFYVACINPGTKLVVGNRYHKTSQYCIHYFPECEDRQNEECRAIGEELTLLLEYLTVNDGLIRGTNMKYEVEDGVLNFYVNYNYYVLKETEKAPYMERLEQRIKLKE